MASAIAQTPAFKLRAPHNGTDYWVFVEQPDARDTPGPWPAMVFMDGDDQFPLAVRAYHAARKAGTVPPLVVVGVGYGASYARAGNRRVRDYTPTAMKGEPGTGGADDFLEFLTGRLWQELTGRYPLQETERGIGGHSLGSLFVLHALIQRKPFFNRVLASAPALWFDEKIVVQHTIKLRQKVKQLPARLFLAIGAKDTPSMREDLGSFEKQLAADPFKKLEIISRTYAECDHHDVLPRAFREGLGFLFREDNESRQIGKVEEKPSRGLRAC